MSRIPVAVLGATGVVGQRFVRRLADHPMFEIAALTASDRSAGKTYREACEWRLDGEPYGGLGDRVLLPSEPEKAACAVAFSALDSGPAKDIEPAFAAAGVHVFSNAATYRMDLDVPLLVPEVNPGHLALLPTQRQRRGWKGSILTNPNCTTTVLVMALAPLHEAFGVETVLMTSMQAVSGAGYPGVASLDIMGNVLPHIRNEEEKVEVETGRLLGQVENGLAVSDPMTVSALCWRVPVLEGHSESVSVKLKGDPTPDQVREVLAAWKPLPQQLGLPSAPAVAVRVHTAENRPQVRRDVEMDGGMSVHVGRVRPCPVLGIKFALLGHNTERGAAGGSILNAELAVARKAICS
ncbi:aspartate-semialdehyde dehydrogenase [Mesoterricola sediminis]|uniref:aspartate-semialdehyde dehydrogenase n=1 Tax=Mesoterricola sediminis TaxID=2927980 RepID=A0AA48KB61_9BACT|nr:aspartate-semialdehyde dehydrogenase [Mesoterricola sediminis]BDU75784.1 aspartate-semialdehyde dehydrogenase [Mesoterricola sediminis]